MKTQLLLIASVCLFSTYISAQTIWNGAPITFTKPNNADWTQAANQDRITPNVWITRGNTEGIFNIKQESSYDKPIHSSPKDTEWAIGTTSNLGSLVFDTWYNTVVNDPPSKVGIDMVVHLITDDIYIDIKFTAWSVGFAGGGGFSYDRSTDSGLSTDDASLKTFTISPNPSRSEINLDLPSSVTNVSVKVFDILGKEVYSNTTYKAPINILNWGKGIYLVQVTNNQSTQTKRFIKN